MYAFLHAGHRASLRRLTSVAAIAVLTLVGQSAVTTGARADEASNQCTGTVRGAAQEARFGGIARPTYRADCGAAARVAARGFEAPYEADTKPPLRYGATAGQTGKVMASDPATPLTMTPIFWGGHSAQYGFSPSYMNLIQQYLGDVVHDSGATTNVFSSLTQYYMTSKTGPHVRYDFAGRWVTVGHPLVVTDPIPQSCTVNKGPIYQDNSSYSTCVADTDIAHEVQKVLARKHWTADSNHLYQIFLPKHVEVCFYKGNPSYQQCTVNHSRSAAFCAYHSFAHTAPTAIYATLPYPIYGSATGYSCSTEFDAPGVDYPNGKPDADTVLSSLSHETSEAITDPRLDAWIARDGNENGDLCSDIYGALTGPSGQKWNQTINGHHYLTQEEFSNKEYVLHTGGCVQDENVPTVTSVSPAGGLAGRTVTVHGTGLRPGRTTVSFDGTAGTAVSGSNTTKLTVTAPAGPLGVADVTVTTPNGTSALTSGDVYTDTGPAITNLTPGSGPSSSTTQVTIDGSNFVPYPTDTTVTFDGVQAAVISASRTELVVTAPAHPGGAASVPVVVTTPQGTASASFDYSGCRCG